MADTEAVQEYWAVPNNCILWQADRNACCPGLTGSYQPPSLLKPEAGVSPDGPRLVSRTSFS